MKNGAQLLVDCLAREGAKYIRRQNACTMYCSSLDCTGFATPQLKIHVRAALNCGASRKEVVEVITQMIAYCGFPGATNPLMGAKDVFAELDA